MYGVSKISIEPSLMMISVQDVEFKGNSLARYLQIFADTGVVVDMISQSAPHGTTMDFSFTASASDLPLVMKAISAANLDKDAKASPLISVGYSKLNLFGEEMVTSCGVAARALNALAMADIEVLLITTSDLDISLLVRAENEDAAYDVLKKGGRLPAVIAPVHILPAARDDGTVHFIYDFLTIPLPVGAGLGIHIEYGARHGRISQGVVYLIGDWGCQLHIDIEDMGRYFKFRIIHCLNLHRE